MCIILEVKFTNPTNFISLLYALINDEFSSQSVASTTWQDSIKILRFLICLYAYILTFERKKINVCILLTGL